MSRSLFHVGGTGLPGWVPVGAVHYLAHTEQGATIRELARQAGCHASTVLRQVRRIEARRDDPLVDAALQGLARCSSAATLAAPRSNDNGKPAMMDRRILPDAPTLAREGCRILRRMCEAGAMLAVSGDMEKAIVIRSGPDSQGTRTATVDRSVAEAMALKNWITCEIPGRVARYRITPEGRSMLSQFMAEQENRAGSLADGPPAHQPATDSAPRMRAPRNDPPLLMLARRREKDGSPFLTRDLIVAGERLREDFELAQIAPGTTQNWERFLSGPVDGGRSNGGVGHNASDAAGRLAAALNDLGPGLGDIALRCCCQLEGLESVERRMGWSARSGKIVLRIALQRLRLHYANNGTSNDLIG